VHGQEKAPSASSGADAARAEVTCRDQGTQRPASDALRDPALYRSMVDALSTRYWHAARLAGPYQFFDAFQKFGEAARIGRRMSSSVAAKSIAEVMERAALQNVQHLELMMPFDAGAQEVSGIDVSWEGDSQFQAHRERALSGGLRNQVAERRQWLDTVEQDARAILRCGRPAAKAACDVSVRYVAYALPGVPPERVFAQAVFAFELAAAEPRIAGVNW
jgi:adenosine deaminase